jgi:hypothetical protein
VGAVDQEFAFGLPSVDLPLLSGLLAFSQQFAFGGLSFDLPPASSWPAMGQALTRS